MTEVAIGLVVAEGHVLVCQRQRGDRFEDCWEFPGGKIEAGETPEECLHRELGEELGIAVRVVCSLPVIRHDYGDLKVQLWPFVVEVTSGKPENRAARALRWVNAAELVGLRFPQANAGLIPHVATILSAGA